MFCSTFVATSPQKFTDCHPTIRWAKKAYFLFVINLSTWTMDFSKCGRTLKTCETMHYLRSIAKQIITTYINHSQAFISDGMSLNFVTRFEKREKPDLYMLSAKQGSIWYNFYNVFGMKRSGFEPTIPHSQGRMLYHWTIVAGNVKQLSRLWGSIVTFNHIVVFQMTIHNYISIFTFAYFFWRKKRSSFCMTHMALSHKNDVIVYLI